MSAVTAADIARVAYEARRAYAVALGQPAPPAWEEAPADERSEAIAGAEAVLSGEARCGAHLHAAWTRRAEDFPVVGPGLFSAAYDQLGLAERRKVLLFRAVVLALVDGPCNGFCHDDKCANLEDHDCHLETCLSKFGVPPGLWRAPAPHAPQAGGGGKLYC
jgi:hypothetical protein